MAALKTYATKVGVADRITFINGFVEDQVLRKYIAASDVIVMNYLSQHHESSAACLEALSQGAIVATSLAPAFTAYGDAVWNITSGYPISLSLEALLTNNVLRSEIKNNIEKFRGANSWSKIRDKTISIYQQLGFSPQSLPRLIQEQVKEEIQVLECVAVNELEKIESTEGKVTTKKGLRILMQNRPNAYTQPGGDTVVMEKTREGLLKRGVSVTVDVEAKEDPRNYDLVHLFNFATPDYTKILAERAYNAKVPFVATTLYEDVPNFHNQSHVIAELLRLYVSNGQNRDWFRQNKPNLETVRKANRFENGWIATHASGLFVTGAEEGKTLIRDYGQTGKIFEMMLGCEVTANATSEMFVNKYGIKDFILCVGRIESRKNQLMLLKALEDVEIPVVIAGSGFTYQSEYDQAVKAFKRKGPTHFLSRLEPEMLASAYCAAKVHALPSWYELPGLVSLEAAYYGCNIVTAKAGTPVDYFGDLAFYCDPSDEDSIRHAVLQAYRAPYPQGLKEAVMANTWDDLGAKALNAYNEILGISKETQTYAPTLTSKIFTKKGESMAPTYDMDTGHTDFQDLLERGEQATMDQKTEDALSLLSKAERINPNSTRLLRALGALYMSMSNIFESEKYFDRAINSDGRDAKSLIGRGMCDMMKKSHATAYNYFVQALRIAPDQLVALHQLLECSFALGRYDDIKSALETYLIANPNDLEMRFCLAGCYFKSRNITAAQTQVNWVLAKMPTHPGAQELKKHMDENKNEAFSTSIPIATGVTGVSSFSPVTFSEERKTETVAPVDFVPVVPSAGADVSIKRNHDIDLQLAELNEDKRKRNLDVVKQGCERILYRGEATGDQKEYAMILKAEVAILEGDIDQAAAIYQQISEINPRCARALCGQAAIKANGGDWVGAEVLFTKASEIDPNSDIAIAGLGMCTFNAKNPMKAWDLYNKALQLNKENLRALLGIIELGYPMKRLAEVEAAVKGYLDLHPADVNFIYSLAGCYFAQEKYSEALEELEKVLLFEPANEHAIELRNLILTKVGAQSGASQ